MAVYVKFGINRTTTLKVIGLFIVKPSAKKTIPIIGQNGAVFLLKAR